MTTAGDLVNILETTRSPRVLLTVQPGYVAPVYGAQAVISVAGSFHGTVETCLYLINQPTVEIFYNFLFDILLLIFLAL